MARQPLEAALEAAVTPTQRSSQDSRKPRYVVGVDGSQAGIAAARWALDRAARDGAEVHLVHAYLVQALVSVAGPLRTPDMHRLARRDAGRVLSSVLEQLPSGSLIDSIAVEGAPDRVLLECSESADLLVLGARPQHRHPHARFIGSTAARCLRGSPCPVVMVPGPAEPAGAAPERVHAVLAAP
jgi:nucleotide-binding universal stress UspA family protein